MSLVPNSWTVFSQQYCLAFGYILFNFCVHRIPLIVNALEHQNFVVLFHQSDRKVLCCSLNLLHTYCDKTVAASFFWMVPPTSFQFHKLLLCSIQLQGAFHLWFHISIINPSYGERSLVASSFTSLFNILLPWAIHASLDVFMLEGRSIINYKLNECEYGRISFTIYHASN